MKTILKEGMYSVIAGLCFFIGAEYIAKKGELAYVGGNELYGLLFIIVGFFALVKAIKSEAVEKRR